MHHDWFRVHGISEDFLVEISGNSKFLTKHIVALMFRNRTYQLIRDTCEGTRCGLPWRSEAFMWNLVTVCTQPKERPGQHSKEWVGQAWQAFLKDVTFFASNELLGNECFACQVIINQLWLAWVRQGRAGFWTGQMCLGNSPAMWTKSHGKFQSRKWYSSTRNHWMFHSKF